MVKFNRELVEGIGISPDLPENPMYFTEVTIPEILKIPEQKPDMEQLLAVIVQPKIVSVRVVDTPCALSYEGQHLSGYKLVIEMMLWEKIKYVADEPTQSVHAAEYEQVLKSVFVVVPCEFGGKKLKDLLRTNRIVVTPYVEDIYGEMRDKRTIFKNIALLIDVTFRETTCKVI